MSVKSNKTNTKLSNSFIENHKDINEDEAIEKVTSCSIIIKELEETKKNDAKLKAAREIAKDLSSAYSAAIKYEKAKIQFLLERIEAIRDNNINPTSGLNDDEE